MIILGAGELYLKEFTEEITEIPDDATLEVEANNVGNCSSGFAIDYKPEKYDVRNQYNKIVKSFITNEVITARTGILNWNLKNINLLSTGKYTEENGKKTLVFTGSGVVKTVLLRFVHTKEDGKKIRFTMVGQSGAGFAVEFGNTETTVNAEITAIEAIKGFVASFEEEIPTPPAG